MRLRRRNREGSRRRRAAAAAVGVLLLAGGVAGCSGGSDSADASDPGAAGAGSAGAGSAGAGSAGAGDSLTELEADGEAAPENAADTRPRDPLRSTTGAGRTGVRTRQVISVGRVSLEAKDLGSVRDEIDRQLGRFGGYVTDEQTTNDDSGAPEQSTLVLRVPSPRFEQVMSAFKEFATVIETDREATDVTTEVIDVAARIRTQEVSLQRLRKFLGEAGNVTSMIRLESEIADREADLASLEAQQQYLDDQTSLSTIKVTMNRTQVADDTPQDDPLEDAGFLTGLHNGWQALLDILVVTFTILGALTPFAVALALLGVPSWLWLRATRRRKPA